MRAKKGWMLWLIFLRCIRIFDSFEVMVRVDRLMVVNTRVPVAIIMTIDDEMISAMIIKPILKSKIAENVFMAMLAYFLNFLDFLAIKTIGVK